MGVVVCALLGLQPIFGWLHHLHYVKNRKRGVISHVHIWYGRALMVLGIVNGGLGLSLAQESRGFVTAYIVVAVVVGLMYLGSILFRVSRNRRSRPDREPKLRVNSVGGSGEGKA